MDRTTYAEMMPNTARLHKFKNALQSVLLIGGMATIAAICAWTIWGPDGIVWAFAGVALALVLTPSIPPTFVLSMYRARPFTRAEFPEGYAIVTGLAERAGLPSVPRLYYIPSTILNAFALGSRNEAAIAMTDGLLRTLTPRELLGVLAHEISHVRNNDLWIMNLADTMSRITGTLSYFGMMLLFLNLPLLLTGAAAVSWLLVLVLIFAPTIMSLLQLALSRSREYDADLGAVELTGDPAGLISALEKLERYQGRFWEDIFYPGRRIPEPSLLRTHPPTEERIRRLQELRQSSRTLPGAQSIALPNDVRRIEGAPRWRWPGLWY